MDNRRGKLVKWCRNRCLDPSTVEGQVAVGFERCVGSTGHPDQDGVYHGVLFPGMDGKTYQALDKRKRNARDYYDTYSKYNLSSDLVFKPRVIITAGVVGEHEDKIHEKVEKNIQ